MWNLAKSADFALSSMKVIDIQHLEIFDVSIVSSFIVENLLGSYKVWNTVFDPTVKEIGVQNARIVDG